MTSGKLLSTSLSLSVFICKFISVAKSCPTATPWTPAWPGFLVLHYLLEFAQTHGHWVSDAIQPSHLLSFPSPVFNVSQHQSFSNESVLHTGGLSIGVSASASVLPMNTQDWSPSAWTGWISLQSKGLSRVFSNTTVQKHQFLALLAFFTVQLSHPYMTTGKTIALTDLSQQSNISAFEYTI